MPLLLHNPAFWTGAWCGFTALALIIIAFLLVAVPELRELRWPALPSTTQPNAREGREERAAEHAWSRDAEPANEPGVINLSGRIDVDGGAA
jgi:hypothetical protein